MKENREAEIEMEFVVNREWQVIRQANTKTTSRKTMYDNIKKEKSHTNAEKNEETAKHIYKLLLLKCVLGCWTCSPFKWQHKAADRTVAQLRERIFYKKYSLRRHMTVEAFQNNAWGQVVNQLAKQFARSRNPEDLAHLGLLARLVCSIQFGRLMMRTDANSAMQA